VLEEELAKENKPSVNDIGRLFKKNTKLEPIVKEASADKIKEE
jgi:hypothetical protein